jgi:uncharacterized protein
MVVEALDGKAITQGAQLLGISQEKFVELYRRAQQDEDEARQSVLLNPGRPKDVYSYRPCAKGETTPCRWLEEQFAIDPETLAIYRLEDCETLPITEGRHLNLRNWQAPPKVSTICFSVTRACNLRCRYCYVQNRPEIDGTHHEDAHMSMETVEKALNLTTRKGVSISFFGGEALLRADWIREVVDYAKRTTQKPRFHLTTNATLLTPEMAEFMRENRFSLIVSVDGPPDIHNFNRPMASDLRGETGTINLVAGRLQREGEERQSYAKTLEALAIIRELDYATGKDAASVTLRSTFTADYPAIRDRVAHLHELMWQGYGNHCSVEPVSSSEASCIDPTVANGLGIGLETALGLREEYRAAFDWCREQAEKGLQVRWHHLSHFVERILSRKPSASECGAGKGYLHITPDGTIFACHREAGDPIGHVDTGIDERVRWKWADNRLYAREGCQDCWCRFICGGGCRADSLVHCGRITKPYPTSCTLMQICISETIRLLGTLPSDKWSFLWSGGQFKGFRAGA